MKFVRQLLIILFFVWIGEAISSGMNLSIPGNIMGMLLLLVALLSGKLKISYSEDVSDFLLKHMTLFFVPAGVGILTVLIYIKNVWAWIILISVISTLVVMIVTALVVSLLRRKAG